ncbi:TIGR01777 family oxidoreductase [bacterium AH-315-N03]|nr:TIGR01777 family oxidoreductase [bacterium AH-315-N03]MBN4049446.1 TIGR01777 family oxidoreductase [bacterium AH-315-N03]
MGERVLISGVTGFVGRRLAAALHEAGHEVSGLSRDAVNAIKRVPELSHTYTWLSTHTEPQHEAFEDKDVVVHLAGEPVQGRWTAAKKRAIENSRIEGTARLVEAIEHCERRPRVLVSASAIGYYGNRGDEELTEKSEQGDDFLAKVCINWEREARVAGALRVRVVMLRIGIVMGPGGGALGAMLPLFKLGLGGRLGPGTQWWPWIHIDDLVRIIRYAIEDETMKGPVNAVAPTPVRQAEFTKTLGKVLHRPSFLPAPSFALKAILGGFGADLISSRRVLPARLLDSGFEFDHPELEGALTEALG